jgi:hypothetical protein
VASPSILTSIKKSLGLEEAYTAFDADLVMYINTALSTLNQIGIGPVDGFQIEDKTPTWDTLIGTDPRLNFVPSYVLLKTRLIFDPPATSFAIDAIKTQITEYEWRINTFREVQQWVMVIPPVLVPDE